MRTRPTFLLWPLLFVAMMSAGAQSTPITLPGLNVKDKFTGNFWGQQSNASNTVQGLNANAGTNRFAGALLPQAITNALTGNTVSGLWPVSADLTFDGDPISPNTNWVHSVLWQNLELLGNTQTREVNWYGKENLGLSGGIVTIYAYTNLSFVTPATAGVFSSNNMVLALTGQFDANGNPTADFFLVSDSRFTALAGGKVVGVHATTKKLVESAVDIGDVASSATVNTAINAKLAATNGVAVNLSGSVTNITVDGGGLLRVPPFTPAVNEVSVPAPFQNFQRTNAVAGLITVTANVAGPTGTAVEARFGSGSWASVGASGTDGNITGYLVASAGRGDVQVRLTGTTNAMTISDVRVGDIFLVAGQSGASGRSTYNQVSTNILSGMYGNDGVWKALVDPVDSATNQVDAISADYDAGGMGSPWPLVADEFIAATGIPIAFVPVPKGSTGFGVSQPTWNPTADHFDTSTLFGSAMSRLRAVGGKVAAVLWWQGEGGFDDPTGATYNVPFSAMAAVIAEEFPGTKIIPAKIQDCTGVLDARQTNGWYAIGRLWATNSNVLRGPTLADAPVGGSGNIFAESEGSSPFYHIKSSTNTAAAAHRWATNLIAHFP